MSLETYKRKRNFKKTPEPEPKKPKRAKGKKGDLRFAIQLHSASRRHYDFRLEVDGAMKSWAVPRGPSLDPNDQRLAVMVEDHPMDYNLFEGIIPKGNYGAGTVLVWDEGTYVARGNPERVAGEEELRKGLADGHITFILNGKKLQGEFALVKLKKGEPNAWLLVKKRDGHHSYKVKALDDTSVLTGRTLAEVAKEAPAKGEVWLPGKGRAAKETKKKVKVAKKIPKKKLLAQSGKMLKAAPAEEFPRDLRPTKYPIQRHEEARSNVIYEPEWDGYRAILSIQSGKVSLASRLSASLQRKFSQFAATCESFEHDVALDGYLVLLGKDGKPRPKGQGEGGRSATFYIADVLHYDGANTRDLALAQRKTLVESLFPATSLPECLRLNQFTGDIADAESQFSQPAVKGLLAREADGSYVDGEGWIQHFGRETPAPPERETKVPKTVVEKSAPKLTKARGQVPTRLPLTNLNKVFWPKERYTKGDLLDYYKAVAPLMLPHLIDRPQSLNRHPNGIAGKSFFQKEVTGQVPAWIPTVHVASSSGKAVNYALCQEPNALLFLANMGCIEINVWNSRWQTIEYPDYVVVDIDPGKVEFSDVLKVALTARQVLDDLQAYSYCKTSGGRGLHIYVPIKPKHTHEEVREFSLALSQTINGMLPEITSLERSPGKRTRLIYLDYLQNRRGQTMAAPYSARPREHAPVSMPLRWSEITKKLDPLDYTIKTAMKRLDRLGDAWADMYDHRNDLKQLSSRLKKREA